MRSLCSWFYRFPPISSLHTSAFPFHFWENHRAVLLRWTVSAPLGSMEGSVEERLQRLEAENAEMRAEIALKNKSDAGVCSPKQRASSQQASSQQPAASSQRAASEQQAASSEQRAASSKQWQPARAALGLSPPCRFPLVFL